MATNIIIFLTCLVSYTLAGNVDFAVDPQLISPMVTETMTLTCGFNTSTTDTLSQMDIDKLVSISVSKDGEDLATVTNLIPVTAIRNQSVFAVTGEIVGHSGYVQLTNQYPMGSQSGSYQCLVAGLDSEGHPQTLSKIVQVDANEVSYEDILSEIRTLKLEKESSHNQCNRLCSDTIKLQNNSITEISSNMSTVLTKLENHNSLINGLTAANILQDNSINSVNNSLTGLDQRMSKLELDVNSKVHFSAYISNAPPGSPFVIATKNTTVVFETVATNLGNGYNSSSGIFTCPQSGAYLFIFHMMNVRDKSAILHLTLNNGSWGYARLRVDDENKFNSASNSVILDLNQGDTVDVRADELSYLYPSSYTSFTGILLSLK